VPRLAISGRSCLAGHWDWLFQERLLDAQPLAQLGEPQRAEGLEKRPAVAGARQSAQRRGVAARIPHLLHRRRRWRRLLCGPFFAVFT
jgi:hypothetical protein